MVLVACSSGSSSRGETGVAPREVAEVVDRVGTAAGLEDETYRLFGVSADGGRAYVIGERRRAEPPMWALDTIDLATGTRTDAWEAAAVREYAPFASVDGTLAGDLIRGR